MNGRAVLAGTTVVSRHWHPTSSEPHLAQIWAPEKPYLPGGLRRPIGVPNCSSCPSEQPHIPIHESTMDIVYARAINV